MTNKEKYKIFEQNAYVPVFSKHWWMDAVCGKDNWDVWIYEEAGKVMAAMPYYVEYRNLKKYITKAVLTQNNGIIFLKDKNVKLSTKYAFEERVINEACKFISSQECAVYEQQFHYSFDNWLPFLWNGYKAICRYTYVIRDTSDKERMWENISSKYRGKIKKGQKNTFKIEEVDKEVFYQHHRKIFDKQNLPVPFTYEKWVDIYEACKKNNNGLCLTAKDSCGEILSLVFLIWDEKSMYHLLGGGMPEYQNLDTYNALTWHAIKIASERGLSYDFEGSVIKRISKSFREFGGVPERYFRIRKVFDPEIILNEALMEIDKLKE